MVEMAEHDQRRRHRHRAHDPAESKAKAIVVTTLTTFTMLCLAAILFAPVLWGIVHLYRWALA